MTVGILALFLVGVLTGSKSGQPKKFWLLAVLMFLIWVGLCVIWQDVNNYPGLFAPAFGNMQGKMFSAMVIGIMIGRIFLSREQKRFG